MSVSPADTLFDSAWMKWKWACVHAKALHRDTERFGLDPNKQPFFTIQTDYNPRRHGFVVTVQNLHEYPPTWGTLVGDIAFNLRCSLDHVAWALVENGRTPPAVLTAKQRRNVYFPILSTRNEFNASVGRMLPGVSRANRAIVRRYQPYTRGKRKARRDPLALLAVINNHDKHRIVQPLGAMPAEAVYNIVEQRDCLVTGQPVRASRRALENDAELTVIRARKMGPNPHLKVQASIPAKPTVADRVWLEEFLNLIPIRVGELLMDVSEPPDFLDQVEFPGWSDHRDAPER